jgi:hypothetical protein
MNASLTIRLSEKQRQQLRKLATRLGKSDSELVRQMIERGLAEATLGQRIAHLKGSLPNHSTAKDPLCRAIHERNWRT